MCARLPLDLEALRACIRDGQSFTYLPFYGHTAEPGRITNAVYSQFYPVEFQIDGVRYRWAEQSMMAAKARLFGDQEALAAILGADEPLACKKIGRTVRKPRGACSRISLAIRSLLRTTSRSSFLINGSVTASAISRVSSTFLRQ
jgi:predicted NAD-dependent protein-ADP-ribosyltransferase YbiA (DUF1768 family)